MASTYLERTSWGTPTNTYKATFSAWIKRGTLSSNNERILCARASSANTGEIALQTSNELRIYQYVGAEQINVKTNRIFRDTSAWYHIVVAFDTTQGTSTDRIKVYVNGVQETSFANTTYPSQNQTLAINNSLNPTRIGTSSTSSDTFFTGSMSHFHFIDGTAYDASAFGETDTTTGEWKGKTSPSVTYGTNGFFILKDGNGITDQSSNSNNFTLGGGTLTDLKDNPDNVFCTMNPLDNFFTGSTFTNGNNTIATGSNTASYNTGTLGVNTGKFYWEVKVSSLPSNVSLIGIASKLTTSTGTTLGTNANDYAIYSYNGNKIYGGNSASYGNSFTLNDVIGVALDCTNNKLYFSKNGTWQNSGVPTSGSTGTGAISIASPSTTPTGFYFPSVGDWSMSSSLGFQVNFGNGFFGTTAITTNSGNGYSGAEGSSKFNYTVPTGYSALSTKGLNE